MSMHRALGMPLAAVAAIVAVVALTGCVQKNPVATFQVIDETYKIELTTPELQEHAQQLLDGEDVAGIPNGVVVRDDSGVNAPWSWHIDPETLEFASITIEVCDGLPSFVEEEIVTSDRYCPWSAEIISID